METSMSFLNFFSLYLISIVGSKYKIEKIEDLSLTEMIKTTNIYQEIKCEGKIFGWKLIV